MRTSKSPAATTQLLLRIPFFIQQQRLGSQLAVPKASDLFSNAEGLPDLPEGWPDNLYNRVAVVGDPRRSVVPVLERWVQEGNPVEKTYLQGMVKQMRVYRRYAHALEVLSNFQHTFSSSQSVCLLNSRVHT